MNERIEQLKKRIAARERATGMEENVKALKAELAREERREQFRQDQAEKGGAE